MRYQTLALLASISLLALFACTPAASPSTTSIGEVAASSGRQTNASRFHEEEVDKGPMYEWAGVVAESEIEGWHLELQRGCDVWALMPISDEVEEKLEQTIGCQLIVRGTVFGGPTVFQRPSVRVRTAFTPEEPVL